MRWKNRRGDGPLLLAVGQGRCSGAWILASLLAACGPYRAYEGRQPREAVARIAMTDARLTKDGLETKRGVYFSGAYITYSARVVAIDGRMVPTKWSVEVLPGHHVVEIEWERKHYGFFWDLNNLVLGPVPQLGRRTRERDRIRVSLEAEAGRSYELIWVSVPLKRVGVEGREEWMDTGGPPTVRFEANG